MATKKIEKEYAARLARSILLTTKRDPSKRQEESRQLQEAHKKHIAIKAKEKHARKKVK